MHGTHNVKFIVGISLIPCVLRAHANTEVAFYVGYADHTISSTKMVA